ncbi:MAG: TonB-dependent receptor plug domain-containing protein [Paludibacter sp.]|nr:TonB-dependent receptor plug domain-containing protein [Paludibacter sp.]
MKKSDTEIAKKLIIKQADRLTLLVLFASISFYSFSVNNQGQVFSRKIETLFGKYLVNIPQEKVYLQTDKPYYSAGEAIWFKAYVVNAASHLPNTLSRFIYVELIDKSNAVITRVKIKKDSLGFAGFIELKPELSSGNYALRAYTYWMQNIGTDFFFKKNIYIGNAIDNFVSSRIIYGKTINDQTPVSIIFSDASKKAVTGKTVELIQNWNTDRNKKTTLTTDKEGKISWLLTDETVKEGTSKFIEVSINDPGYQYKNRFFIPVLNNDFDVQFFPESGNLLTNFPQIIAFKAIGPDGLSVEVTGKIFSDQNTEVTQFSTSHKGMGKFTLQPNSGEKYYALVKAKNGMEKRFELPASQTQGVSLHLSHNKSRFYYEIRNNTAIQNSALFLLIHSRGRVLVIQALDQHVRGFISESLLPEGIVSFAIIDSVGNTYCERLSFVNQQNTPIINMETDKPVYGKRKPVNLSLKIQSALGKSLTGNFSISITDNSTVKQDSLSDNILSYLLLCSDIRGYIEDPAAYFKNNTDSTREKQDILMLTQGWSRFNTADIIKGKQEPLPYYMEAGQTITGKVLNIFNKPSKNCGIILFSPYRSTIKLTQTDSTGCFLIDGIDFPDSTSFILKAKKKNTFGDVEIISDPDVFPKTDVYIPVQHPVDTLAFNDYSLQSKEKYYTEGGLRMVNLGEVTVDADAIKKNKENHYYSGLEGTRYTAEQLENYPGYSIFNILSMMPGVRVSGESVYFRNSDKPPLFLIDDIESTNDEIAYLNANDVEEISVFNGANATIFGSRGSNGVVAIALKKGYIRNDETPPSLINISPLGYQKSREFYVPKYNIDDVRLNTPFDLRTTIYWNPKLELDSTGTAHVRFFSADKPNNYTVVLEGITNKGEICRYVGILRRED